MMLNYMKGEAFRIVHGKEIYLLTGIVAALALAANVLLWGGLLVLAMLGGVLVCRRAKQ